MRILVSVAAILSCVVTPPAVAESMSANLIDAAVEQRLDAIMKEMTLEQKIAQMIQPEIKSVTPQDIRRYGFGSILNGGGSFPQQNKQDRCTTFSSDFMSDSAGPSGSGPTGSAREGSG